MTPSDGDRATGDGGGWPRRFAGRRALVTGASRGIGAAIARRLAAEGADVAIVARTAERHPTLAGSLAETASALRAHGGRVAAVTADLASPAGRAHVVPDVERALGGPVDILVNNAAASIQAPVRDFPARRRMITFEVNVHAPFELAQAVIPAMVERGAGWIVNLSSASARPWPGPPFALGATGARTGVYGASKAALNRLTNALGAELHGTGVRVNSVEPRAAVLSEGADALVGAHLSPDQIESMEQMVEATVYLCACPPDVTAGNHVSLDLLAGVPLRVRSLDGTELAG
ncbi:SDR family NAD(P)-dependent oxidoreductase [Frankia sp. CNm7]|uniref:SDR family NAD(P)-dependent oxidoreductase n=1 Tax=Frankia nepalensis TaxID=1836974 RepID=A0A937UK62_9ACTN|nr:SDR family NAD(P)-dependent oxidoreductase [Frankia nepalensis]MBL7499602.1 SDR family NAD(P)-dependent oxidoreductase [Frankia nepalensis]MBL7516112.1 SDR family NAD(P)-dependent oxidoreductase [Frankia nepalensis]MBL7519506.1 SDR family NAD(P)-dependent oxidoreductase [Frankia nepalensis]MBL7626489.1 SDR family NAD(P)-dependent oxidoreductase [Frankia nepalensis]